MIEELCTKARQAALDLVTSNDAQRAQALKYAAEYLRAQQAKIITANEKDMSYAREKNLDAPKCERLMLNAQRIEAMAMAIEAIANLPNPLGRTLHETTRPNGLMIKRIAVPLGVLGVIYEARPNVTSDAAALAIKSGNAVILRGGSEIFHSSQIIGDCLHQALDKASLNPDCVQIVPTRERIAVTKMLQAVGGIDVIIPRGGKSLVGLVQEQAKVPVFAHLDGICHLYIDDEADLDMACDVVTNAKLRRVSICGALETLLVHQQIADKFLPQLEKLLQDCEIRGCEAVRKILTNAIVASEDDWSTEYLDKILSIKIIDNMTQAIGHINHYGSHHTDGIITENQSNADSFLNFVDSAITLHNCSTQFADGGEFGMGAEIGIATGKLHARGPVGLEQLTTYKYKVTGNGQTRSI